MKRLLYVLSNNKLRFARVLGFGLVLNAVFAVADSFFMKLLVDEGLMKRNFQLFVGCAALVISFGVGIRVAFLKYELLSQRLRNSLAESLTLRMLKSYFGTRYADIVKSDGGYFTSRIYDEPGKVAQGIVGTVIGLLVSVVRFAAGFALSVYLSSRLTLVLSLVVPALYFLASRFSPRIKAASERENEEEARLREVLGKSVDSYKTVNVFGLHAPVYSRVGRHLDTYFGALYKRVKTSQKYQAISGIWLSLAEALVLIGAGWEVVSGNLTIGGLFAFVNTFWKIVGSATGIVNQVTEASRLSGYIDRLVEFETLARPAERSQTNLIGLVNVRFRYDGGNIFDGLNLRIVPSERVLIVGPNGCGKTTLGHLIAGFLEPSDGEVQVPGLERISAMLSPFRFAPGSLKDNVNYEHLSGEKIRLFWELVRELGLEGRTEADASSELSEGERKRGQIVMTLLKDADIYLFDEPLANIDPGARDAAMQAQFEHTRGKTVISIMHGDEKYHRFFDRVIHLGELKAVGQDFAQKAAFRP